MLNAGSEYARRVNTSKVSRRDRESLENLETLTGKRIEQIRVIGGGAKNRLLDEMTADATRKQLLRGRRRRQPGECCDADGGYRSCGFAQRGTRAD